MIIIHEYGEPSHYMGLTHLCEKNGEEVKFKEFSTLKLVYRGIKIKSIKNIIKAINDFIFLTMCFFFPFILKNERVILGIAPKDWRIIFFNRILKYAKVTYHTSWHLWSGEKYPKKNKFMKKIVDSNWTQFLHKTIFNIAAVTENVKLQLNKYMGIELDKIIVVYHSYDEKIFFNKKILNKKYDLVYIGRLVPEKGIEEIIEISKKNSSLKIAILGQGPDKEKVVQYTTINNNFHYLGYISNRIEIANILNQSRYLILPSKRSADWEELFGMVIIEALACGCIPLCTDHNGPKIILENSKFNKYIFQEQEIVDKLTIYFQKYEKINESGYASELAKRYSKDEVSKRWNEVIS